MKSQRSGFSLVEMLVAVVLITLLIGIAMFAFKYQLIMIKKTKTSGINRAIIYNQLKSSISSIKYYVVDEYDMLGYPMQKLHHFFRGTQKEMEYITTNPLFSKNIAVVKLTCKEQNLIYKEEPLYKNINFLKPQVKDDSRENILLQNLDKCQFSYMKNNKKTDELKDIVPSQIVIYVESNKIKPIYINIKSDYNLSLGVIQDVIYPVH